MSQVPMTHAERQRALERFGYTAREAEFLCLAALNGGYFLRRQYDGFLGRQDGGTASQLVERAVARGHARAYTYRQKTNIYHLYARPFYEALGQGDNRNRRKRQDLSIKNKLMGFDFVLAHPVGHCLATEQEKVEYFARALNLPIETLPTKLYASGKCDAETPRYFVEKYPIFLSERPGRSGSTVVSFCFVDEGLATLSRFETFLAQYGQLFVSLVQFSLIYVAARTAHFDGAQRMFERFLIQRWSGKNGSAVDPDISRLLAYFASRSLYETQQLDGFDRAKLVQLRKDRAEFSGLKNEALYERWKTGGDQELLPILAPETTSPAPLLGTFSTCLLEHNYDLFGTFLGS